MLLSSLGHRFCGEAGGAPFAMTSCKAVVICARKCSHACAILQFMCPATCQDEKYDAPHVNRGGSGATVKISASPENLLELTLQKS